MKMTDEYIRRYALRAKGPERDSKPVIRSARHRFISRGYAIIMCILTLLLVGVGIHDRIEWKKAKQEELYWEEYYANRKHDPLDNYDYYTKENEKPYDPQADPLSPYFTAPAYRTGSNNSGNVRKNYTPYKQGYGDGYDEGYDDRVQGMGYGYKYDCDGESDEYRQGYDKGYRDGYTDGYEDYEAFGDDEL